MAEAVKKLVREAWDLDVFKRAYRISLEIHRQSQRFPKEELFGLTNQIRRCSKSICANLAEGFAKQEFSSAEFKRFITIAIGSAAEIRIWIHYCLDLGHITGKQAVLWQEEYKIISRMLRRLYGN